ncbi:MAG: hypothetical protein OEW17_05690 [Gemmatimonadota bacterium]|nr:hypothetical protein [Gemmatimonadota bacterium]MDH4348277.1 hypothetical protein [Gemmatimonadota bacterium]
MARETDVPPQGDTTTVSTVASMTAGEFTPAWGFRIFTAGDAGPA